MSLWLTFKYITLKICSQLFNTSYLSHFATLYFRKWTIRLPFISVSEVINYWNNQKRFSKLCSVISFNHIDEGYSIIAQNTVKKSSTRFFMFGQICMNFCLSPIICTPNERYLCAKTLQIIKLNSLRRKLLHKICSKYVSLKKSEKISSFSTFSTR